MWVSTLLEDGLHNKVSFSSWLYGGVVMPQWALLFLMIFLKSFVIQVSQECYIDIKALLNLGVSELPLKAIYFEYCESCGLN